MNSIHHLELNFDSNIIADGAHGEDQDVSLWSQNCVLPLVDSILEQEWKKISRQWEQSPQKTIPDIRIHHLQLQIQAESTESFKQEFCRCFIQELKASIRYSMHCDSDQWSPEYTASPVGPQSSDLGLTLENVLRIIFGGSNTAHCDGSALRLLERYWQQWAQQDPATLRNSMVEYLQQTPNRTLVASQFPEALQNQIMVVLEPTQADYILRVIAALSTIEPVRLGQHLRPGANKTSTKTDTDLRSKTASNIHNNVQSQHLHARLEPSSPTPKNETPTCSNFSACLSRRYLVEFSLAYMTCERGSRFNRKIYMRSLMRQMAQHNNMDSRALSQHLREILHNVDSSHILKQELLEILEPDDYLGPTVERGEPEIGQVIELDYHRAIRTVTHGLTLANIEGETERGFIHSVIYLLRYNPHKLVVLLRSVNSVANIANVLVNLPGNLQAQLCQHLCASNYYYLEPYLSLVSSLWHRGQGEPVNQAKFLAHVTLVFFLNNNASSVRPLSGQNLLCHYLESVLQGLSTLTGRSTADLKLVFQKTSCVDQKNALWRDIQQGLNLLKTPPISSVSHLPQPLANTVSQPMVNGADQHNVFTPLVKAIQKGDWNISAAHWCTIKSGNVKTIRSLLCLLMQPIAVRQRVVSNLPLTIQAELVGILDLNAQELIQGIWQSTAAIHNLINGFSETNIPQYKSLYSYANHSSGNTSNSLSLAVREFTFSYLVLERGSEFNQRSYARSLLRQMSGRYNVNYQALLVYLQGHLEHAELPKALAIHWRVIVGLDISDTSRSPGSTETQPLAALALTTFETAPVSTWAQQMSLGQEGAAFFSEIIGLLTATSPPNLGRWTVLINVLSDRHSLYFKRLAQRIVDQFIPNENLYRNLSAAALKQLANRCLTLHGVGGQSCSALKYSIEQYALKARDRRAFYVMVIGALLQGGLIDLEHLLKGANHWQPSPSLATVAIPPKHIAANEALNTNAIAIQTPNPSAAKKSIAKNNVMLMSQSLENAHRIADQGEAVLLDYCYLVDPQKMQRLYPVAQVLQMILAHCQTTLLAIENKKETDKEREWAGVFQSNNCLHEKEWLAVIFHGLAVQLVVSKCVSVDWYIQQTVCRVFKLWKLDPKNFAMDGFLKSAIRHLYSGNYSADKPFNYIMQAALQSLTVADIGMEEAEPITPHEKLMPSTPLNAGASHSSGESERQTRLNPESAVECDKHVALEYEKGVLVDGAGVVVLAPYLAVLFQRMALLKDQTIKATEQGKALQLLYYLSHGECAAQVSLPSLWGLFNAICGIKPNTLVPLPKLTKEEQNTCEELLKAVIQHWRVLGATSVAGLRETFLQRWGELRLVDDKGWELKVELHPLDVLLDRLPWGFSVIKYPFMEDAIHVQWR